MLIGMFCLALVAGGAWIAASVLRTRPDPQTLFADALLSIRLRDAAALREALETLQSDPSQAKRVTFLRGARLLLVDLPDDALEEFAKLQPEGELRLPLLTLTGEALYKQGQFQNAEHVLRLAVEEAPDEVDAHRWLATLYYDTGSMDQALVHLGEVARIEPEDFRPHQMRGVIFQDFGDHDKALEAFTHSLNLAKSINAQTSIQLALATSHLARKDFQLALETVASAPDSPEVLAMQADCRWQMGDTSAARELLARAASLGPLPSSAQRLQARANLEDGRPEKAIPLLQSLIAADPSDDESEFLLAMAGQQSGDEPLHARHLARAEHIQTQKTELTRLSQLAMQEPRNADVRDQLAAVCEDLGMLHMMQVWRTAAAACRAQPQEAAQRHEPIP